MNPARGADKGAISPQTSPLPSESLSYPSPTQDPVGPLSQVVVGRMAALRLCLRPCLIPASTNQVEPSSGCREGRRCHLKPRHCPLLLSSIRRPPKTPLIHRIESSPDIRQRYGPLSSSVSSTCKQESCLTQLRVPTRGQFHLKPRHCPLTLSPARRPPKTSLLHQNESSSDVRQRYGPVLLLLFIKKI